MCGPTGCTSTSAWPRSGCAPWWSSGSAATAPRSWWQSPTGCGSRPKAGPSCSATCAVVACRHRCWRSATAPLVYGQRCWVHKTANVLAALPKSVHPGARRALAEISQAESREQAAAALEAFTVDYGVKWPKAVAKVTDDAEALLAFYDYPAEHWVHLRTTNPVESTFATVRLRTRVTKGPGNKQAGLAMAFKLLEAAEQRWRSVNGPHLVALVRAGAVFRKGVLIARPEQDQEAAA